jgi:hypothetical protein
VGAIWASDGYGAGRFDGNRWTDTLMIEMGTFPYLRSAALVIDSSRIWFTSYGSDNGGKIGGVAKLEKGVWAEHDSLSNCSIDNNWLVAMTIDHQGRFWCGERVVGASRVSMFDGKTWTGYDDLTGPDALSNGQGAFVMSLCADSAGSVYIGTCRNGVVKFDGTTKTTYDLTKLINHSNVVSALAYDSQRNILWIGTQWQGSSGLQSGVVKFDGTNWTEYNWSTSPLPEAEISSLATDGNGGVWITTWYDGVAHFDGGSKWDVYHPTNSPLPSDRAWKVDRAQNGDIWVATETGAAKWDGLKWTPFTTANSGIIDNLATVGVDSKGDIWFGSFNGTGVGGACEFDGTKWTPFTTTTSPIGSNLLENIIGGRNGDVWFETYDAGVVRYNPLGINAPCLIQSARVAITDSSRKKATTVAAGGVLRSIVATVDSIPKSLGLTTITLTVNYDEQMLTLRKVVGLNGWTLRKSTPLPNGLSLMLTTSAHDSPAGEQIAAVEFIAFIGRVSKSDLRLSDTHFNPADSNYERCTLASFTADSLQVALENACGNTTLQTFLNKQPLIDILSVSPNPVSVSGSTSMISLNLFLSQDIHATISITDLTGKSAFESSSDMKAGESVIQLSVSGLSEGAYLVTVANGATQVSRKIMVQSK